MVGASGQDDSPLAGPVQIVDDLLALLLHVDAGLDELLPCRVGGLPHLVGSDAKVL